MNIGHSHVDDATFPFTSVGSGGLPALGVTVFASQTGSRPRTLNISHSAASAALVGLMLGTGAAQNLTAAAPLKGTGGEIQPAFLAASADKAVQESSRIANMLLGIKSALGLSISELASIAKVERPTIYAWLDGSQPRHRNLERIYALGEFAAIWKQARLPALRFVISDRATSAPRLQELIDSEDLDLAAIQSALKGIGAGADGVAADLAQQLAAKGFAPRPQRAQNRDRMRVTHRATHG